MIVTTTGGNNKASKDNKNIISVTLGIRLFQKMSPFIRINRNDYNEISSRKMIMIIIKHLCWTINNKSIQF